MHRYILILIMTLLMTPLLTAQEPELPAGVSRAVDRYNQAVERAKQDLLRSLDREEQSATRAGDLDLALAIRELKDDYSDVGSVEELMEAPEDDDDDDAAVLGVRSKGLTIQQLAVGVIAFTNREYVWQTIPGFASEDGWRFIAQAGGSPRSISVSVLETGWLYFASALLPDPKLGAEPLSDRMVYSDPGKTSMVVYRIRADKGNWTTPENGTWQGCVLLLPPSARVVP